MEKFLYSKKVSHCEKCFLMRDKFHGVEKSFLGMETVVPQSAAEREIKNLKKSNRTRNFISQE